MPNKTKMIVVALFMIAVTTFAFKIAKVSAANVYDVNGDGKVDIKDLAATSAAFGSSTGNPRFNASCDVSGDGNVDIKDLGMVADHFGET